MPRPSKTQMEAFIRNHPGFESMHWEDDGCFQDSNGNDVDGLWLYLKSGWINNNSECGTIHEPSLTTVYKELKNNTEYDRQFWLSQNYRRVIGGEFGCPHNEAENRKGCCISCD